MTETTISQVFSDLTDPRVTRTQRHPLVNILTISICAIICGCDDFCAIEEYGKSKQDWFSEFLDLSHGIPSHDTFGDVLNRLNPKEFGEAFIRWVSQLGHLNDDIVAIDGKVMRSTLDKASGNPAIHIVSAWSVKNNLCFGQVKVADKSNEITAIPILLKLLDIKGTTITTDAMGCQYKIGDQIVDKEANYLLALKGNQGEFHDDVKFFLETQLAKHFSTVEHSVHKTVDGEHGRVEQRDIWLTTDVDWLIERHPKWNTVKAIAVVDSTRESGGKVSRDKRYYITSHADKSAEFLAMAIRSHWHVENKLHWQLDVSFNEDQNRLRSGHAAENIALMNKVALNLLKNELSAKVGVKNKRLKAGWDNNYMMKVLTVGFKAV
ncbi:ISAs1 family transposase [Thalassomonas viridans]|uniref:ISAs1 family transposase n=1 Tax=Thalassomonas viridans TaxID=137584 RepID=A0AAE9Z796_9GAMM|nr:ISAs1 family transposase [Thalassomonas viridans]WDE07325.1 ISAs1 family transposase [Thalassomonas viridans]